MERAIIAEAYIASLSVSSMRGSACAVRVRNALLCLTGVLRAEVSLGHSVAAVIYDPMRACSHMIIRAVEHAGDNSQHHYHATVLSMTPVATALADHLLNKRGKGVHA